MTAMNRFRNSLPYLILLLGIVLALYFSAQTALTAKRLQQDRFEDQQATFAEIERIDVRQDRLGCTLESLQRRRPDLFEGADGPGENDLCKEQREDDGGTEQSITND